MPGIYHFLSPNFLRIFRELAKTDKFDYFSNKVIQQLIDLNHPLVQKFVTFYIILPFVIFHILFVVYMNRIYEHRKDDDLDIKRANWVLSIILLCFCVYFISFEIKQFTVQKRDYMTSIWNYIDMIAPIGIIILQIIQFMELYDYEINEDFNRCVLSISTFFMWVKLFYAMRIFKKYGYLIRMIIEVMFDMGVFLLLLLVTTFAFGDSFLRLSYGNESDNQFIDNFILGGLYGYRMIIGDFDTTEFGEVAVPLAWILFVMCTVFGSIVMLNLLIAIISETFARVTENAD